MAAMGVARPPFEYLDGQPLAPRPPARRHPESQPHGSDIAASAP
jgi:hypothetical protein